MNVQEKKFVLGVMRQAIMDLAEDKQELDKFLTSEHCKQLCGTIGMTVEEAIKELCILACKQLYGRA